MSFIYIGELIKFFSRVTRKVIKILYSKAMGFNNSLSSLLEEIKERTVEYYKDNLVSLVVFGSVARGKATPESDIDLLIILKEKPDSSYKTFMGFYENVESKLKNLEEPGLRISPIFLRMSSLKEDMPWLWETEFIVLYDKDGFFRNFLKRLEKFKSKIKLIKKPMPHFVLKDGK